MKVTKFDVRRYSKPYEKPISNGKYTYYATNTVICQIHTDEGITGIGWVDGTDIVYDTVKQLEALVVGEDPFNVERILVQNVSTEDFREKRPNHSGD